ncbi:MAG: 2,3-bisphosphoglycerate-independent phosphoglycerate mutase [Chitinivibrionales bacterium]|nr:2,3-bisphosphoglycerate-independent phosphoglycerate mutase [Chitinivibrionales bacterium]
MDFKHLMPLQQKNDSKIIMLVMDGLGGLPKTWQGKTELEQANTPEMDTMATEGMCGLHVPVGPGITPGSGPGHLGIFGYDPLQYTVGRGVLSALGIDFDIGPDDVAARGNFCTIDKKGNVTDRRAGRIDTETNKKLCEKLRNITINGVEIFIETIKEHRFLLVLRGKKLSSAINDTDPQATGAPPKEVETVAPDAEHTGNIVEAFISQASEILSHEPKANMVLMRGFAKRPNWPRFEEVFGMHGAAIAAYPMYRGLGKLIGMDVIGNAGNLDEELSLVKEHYGNYDFFFVHVKATDSSGEDGDFDRKMHAIEEVDSIIPRILDFKPEVMIITGDHSTPSVLKSHSWHPVPLLIWSKSCRPDDVQKFGESYCTHGALGPQMPAVDIMPMALAHAHRLNKYGA